ncbi:MAG: hypothetical protein DMG65_19480 [Candidatus Angelobacter sp. Gp1-AA117]|nr:MAG: hypothetical protein DMG65_19480 [Candidatus Angelobacter sp. Gp1-AA117]
MDTAIGKNRFRTHLKLWLPDAKSPWGRQLKPVLSTFGKIRIVMLEGFTFADYYGLHTLRRTRANEQVGLWKSAFKPLQAQPSVFDTLTETLVGPCALRVFIEAKQKIHYSIVINHGQTPVAFCRREIRSATNEVFHHFLNVIPEYQSSGIGSRLLCNAVSWYKMLNWPKIHKIYITAGLSAGGSVWPKFGFRPIDGKQWSKTHKRIRLNMERIPSEVRKQFQQQTGLDITEYIDDILASTDPCKIWDISDLDYAENTRSIRIPKSHTAHGYALGTFLLRQTRWKGVLDLTDSIAVDAFKTFFEGKEKRSGISYGCKNI